MSLAEIEKWLQAEGDDSIRVFEPERQLGDIAVSNNTLTHVLMHHYALLQSRHMRVPEWMLVYAICPVHWGRLMLEDSLRYGYHTQQPAGVGSEMWVNLMGFQLYLSYNSAEYPPMCLFHSLGV